MIDYRKREGFTIVEILIVLAIGALIMLVVFLAVPQVQRSSRNNERRSYIALASAQMDAFHNVNDRYPDMTNATEMCDFGVHYLDKILGNPVVCHPSELTGPKKCVLLTGANGYSVCYHGLYSDHGYVGPLDEISIQLSHWCNRPIGKYNEASVGDARDPITNIDTTNDMSGSDDAIERYVVWTNLEQSKEASDPLDRPLACQDNYSE